MSEFVFKSRKSEVELTIQGKLYRFDVSPTNYQFVKNVSSMAREVEEMSVKIVSMDKSSWTEIETAFDSIQEKQKRVIDTLLPGSWDELYAASGEDLLGMVELIVYIGNEIRDGATKAQRRAVEPVEPSGNEV